MLVSAIMPTRARPLMSRTALECWKTQTWKDTELLILDDADDPSFLLDKWPVFDDPGIRYYREPKATIGAKRERLCSLAKGEVIIHFDSDDWSDPGRIAEQVSMLQTGKPMSGYHSLLFWDMQESVGYRWNGPPGFAVGTSMAYTKEFWKSHRWPQWAGQPANPRLDGTDVVVVRQAQRYGITTLGGRGMCIARAHGANTSTARLIGHPDPKARPNWPKVPASDFPDAFFAALRLEAHAA